MISQNRCVRLLPLSLPLWPLPQVHRFLTIYVFLLLSILTVLPKCFAQSQNAFPLEPTPLEESVAHALDVFTHDLIAHHNQFHSVISNQSQQKFPPPPSTEKDDLLATAKARHELLMSLLDEHPDEVLRTAIPSAVRATFPPAVQAYVEEEVAHEGEVEVLIEDWEDGSSRLHYSLKTNTEHLSLHFAPAQPERLLTGSQVRIKGIQIGKSVVLTTDKTGIQALAVAPLPAPGEQRALV